MFVRIDNSESKAFKLRSNGADFLSGVSARVDPTIITTSFVVVDPKKKPTVVMSHTGLWEEAVGVLGENQHTHRENLHTFLPISRPKACGWNLRTLHHDSVNHHNTTSPL